MRSTVTTQDRERGVALLLSIILTSLVLIIGLSVSTTALRLYTNAATARDSIAAAYALDAASECALYHAQQSPHPFSGPGTIDCNGNAIPLATSGGTYTFDVPVGIGVGRAQVDVGTDIMTITSSGFSRTAPHAARLVGRAQTVEVVQTGTPQRADILILLDASSSIEGDTAVPTSERGILLTAVQALISQLSASMNATRLNVGVIIFTGRAGTLSGTDERRPNVPLTGDPNDVTASAVSTMYPAVSSEQGTNLSQALAIARAELNGHVYVPGMYEDMLMGGTTNVGAFATHVRDRDDTLYPDIVFVITDGEPHHVILPSTSHNDIVVKDTDLPGPTDVLDQTAQIASTLHADGASVYVVGVGVDAATTAYLQTRIASDPANYFDAGFDASLLDAFKGLSRTITLTDYR